MSTTLTAEKGSAARAIAKDNSLAFDRHRDFDWDLGTWTMDMSRLSHPLTGSTTWTHMDGVTINSSAWNGRANLAEVEADGPGGRLNSWHYAFTTRCLINGMSILPRAMWGC
jgi:hypothetical protein